MKKSSVPPARVRRTVTRGIVITTALAATLGATAPGVLAAGPTAEAVDPGRGHRQPPTQRVNAAAVVGLDPTADVLLLSDYDFIHALWQKARDAGKSCSTRTGRGRAGDVQLRPADHVAFIVTRGIHDSVPARPAAGTGQGGGRKRAKPGSAKTQALTEWWASPAPRAAGPSTTTTSSVP
ncbi:hypothetical protein SCALM49S_04812 [Streptomyces californicus]